MAIAKEHKSGGTNCGDTTDQFGRCVNMVDRDTQYGIELGPELCKCECHANDEDYED